MTPYSASEREAAAKEVGAAYGKKCTEYPESPLSNMAEITVDYLCDLTRARELLKMVRPWIEATRQEMVEEGYPNEVKKIDEWLEQEGGQHEG